MLATVKDKKYFGSGLSGLPIQTVSMFEKETDDWQWANMDFFDQVSKTQQQDKIRDLRKYKCLSPDYKPADFQYVGTVVENVNDQYGNTEDITHFPIMASPINTIVGEYIKRPLNYYCITNSERARNEYYRRKSDQLKQYAIAKIQQNIVKSLIQEGYDPKQEDFAQQVQQAQQSQPGKIQDKMNKDYQDVVEQISQKIITNLWKTESLDLEFLDGFKHAVITAKEFYHIYSVGNKTKIKSLSPLEVFYHKSPSARWISDAQYAGFRIYVTASSIIDMYRPSLKIEHISKIEELISPDKRQQLSGNSSYRTDVYATHQGQTFDYVNADAIDSLLDMSESTGYQGYYMNNFGLIPVVKAYWKSFKKIGVLEYFDENDEPQEMVIDETYTEDASIGQNITWGYVNQIFEGTKINDDIYLDIQPYRHQHFDEEDLEYCPLPIEGICYNDLHMRPTSMVDLMVPWNELYDIVAAELKKDMRKAIGKVMFMSHDNLPKIPGFTKEKWLYWVREFGIAWVGNNKSQNGNFSHYSSQDMSFAEQMIAKMNILERLEVKCASFAGFSQPRLANSTQVDTAKGAQQDIVTSVNQTEYWYFKHSKLVERVLTHAVNIAKQQLKNKSYLRNMLDDMDQAYVELENLDLPNEKVHVFVTNSSEALAQKETLRALVQPAVQNGADPVDMADILLATTQSEIRNVLDTLRQHTQERRAEEQQLKEQEMATQKQIADDKIAYDREKTDKTLASQERQKMIMTFGFQDDNMADNNGDGTPDMLEYRRQMFDEQTAIDKTINDRLKISHEKDNKNKEHQLKSRELDIKEKELVVEKENQQNDLQIARTNARGRSKSK